MAVAAKREPAPPQLAVHENNTVTTYESDLKSVFAPLASPELTELKLAQEKGTEMVLALPFENPNDLAIRLREISFPTPYGFHGAGGNLQVHTVRVSDKFATIAVSPIQAHKEARAKRLSLKDATIAVASDRRFQGLCMSLDVMLIGLPDNSVIDLTEARKAVVKKAKQKKTTSKLKRAPR